MSELALEPAGEGRFRLNGDLDFDSVPPLLNAGATLFASPVNNVVVDLSGVLRTTSVGLALMLEWKKHAHRVNKTVEYQNVPQQMKAMAAVSGLDVILLRSPTVSA